VKNEVKLESEKIKVNKEMENLADVIKFWAPYNGGRYPAGWYLNW
jgi:hypothetical protein